MGKANKYLILIVIIIAVYIVSIQKKKTDINTIAVGSNVEALQQVISENFIENSKTLTESNTAGIFKTDFQKEYSQSEIASRSNQYNYQIIQIN